MKKIIIRQIQPADNTAIANIIRANLKSYHLDIPGTAYYDPELECLSDFYGAFPDRRKYFVAADNDGTVLGGVGIAEFTGFNNCAEIQKLYISDSAKGKGLGKRLMQTAEEFAKSVGYSLLYLETHTYLKAAVGLYEKSGFRQIEKPDCVLHNTMNLFYTKNI